MNNNIFKYNCYPKQMPISDIQWKATSMFKRTWAKRKHTTPEQQYDISEAEGDTLKHFWSHWRFPTSI